MTATGAALVVVSGLGLGLSLIVAIGAQNAFVLRQGLMGVHVGIVVAACTLSDVVLIVAGVLGAGAVLTGAPWLLTVLRDVGALFLFGYALLAARRALRPAAWHAPSDLGADQPNGRFATLATCLALTWLNPHVYLDTVILLGVIANTHHGQRWSFGLGAAIASAIWFAGLGYGARLLRPVFARPAAWRVLDAAIAVIMISLALALATTSVA